MFLLLLCYPPHPVFGLLITYLLGRPTEVFIQEAADVNGDGAIDTLDAIGIIEIILGRR